MTTKQTTKTSKPAEQNGDSGAALAAGGGGKRGDFLARADGAFVPANLAQAMEFARLLAYSGMVPTGYAEKPGAVLVAVQMGAELGLSPMQAVQNIANINGRPSLWGDAILAVVMGHRDFEAIEEMDLDQIKEAGKAVCVIHRRHRGTVAAFQCTFSIEDAKKAKLWDKAGPWQQYPSRMLKLRARAFACRDAFPDALRGIHVAEEVLDVEAHVAQQPERRAPGAAGVRERVAKKASELPAETGVETLSDLDRALAEVEAATQVNVLSELATSDLVRALPEQDKAKVRDAYRAKIQQMNAAAPESASAENNGELSAEEEARMAAEADRRGQGDK